MNSSTSFSTFCEGFHYCFVLLGPPLCSHENDVDCAWTLFEKRCNLTGHLTNTRRNRYRSVRRYSSRTTLTTRSSYSELGVERLTNALGRHAEMFRARDKPGNALGQTIHRRIRCAIFREHINLG